MKSTPYTLAIVLAVTAVMTSCRDEGAGGVELARYASEDDAMRARFATGSIRLGDRDEPVTVGAAPGYVSDHTCRECHADLADSYHHVGMARAFATPGPDTSIEDFDAEPYHHVSSDRYYEMRQRDGDYYLRRFQRDNDGQTYNELEEKIDFIIGSGSNVRSYVYRTDAGEMYQAPLAWYPRDEKWAMPPGYEEADHNGFLRQITRDCMFCHNAYLDMPVGSDRVGQPQRFPAEMPSGLGCQRCHGPGAPHLEVAYDPFATDEQLRSSIVNPGRLEPRLRDDVCMQCHLQPDSAIMSLVRRTDRPMFSYRPGQPLDDYLMPVDHSRGRGQEDRFQINHHPYRLFQSACYVKSDGALSCLTCHDPHVKVPVEERPAHYRAACLSCHQLEKCDIAAMQVSADAEGEVDCVSCHMVRHRTQDVIEVAMTDHLIRRAPPDTDLTAPAARPEPRAPVDHVVYWPDREPRPDLQIAIARCAMGETAGIKALEEALDEGLTDSIDAKIMLAGAMWNDAQYGDASRMFEEIIAETPDLAHAYEMLGRCQINLGQVDAGLALLTRAWALDDQSASTAYGLGLALNRLGRNDDALARFRGAVELRPHYPDAHLNVGNLLTNARDYTGAIAAYAQVHRIDPLREDGYYFHGLAQLLSGDTAGAVATWQRGLRAAPAAARLHLALATGLIMSGDGEAAESALAVARELEADPVNCDLVDALVNRRLNQPEVARDRWEAAAGRLQEPSATPALRAVLAQLAQRQFGRRGG